MAHPKRQHSKQRTRSRRSSHKTVMPGLQPCSHCNAQIISHRVCPFCGYYKDKPVVEIKIKEKKEKGPKG